MTRTGAEPNVEADDVRKLIAFLESRVRPAREGGRDVSFLEPSRDDMVAGGVHPEAADQVLAAPWWSEMVADVVETPQYADPSESPEQVLAYARDVVGEYVRKRFRL